MLASCLRRERNCSVDTESVFFVVLLSKYVSQKMFSARYQNHRMSVTLRAEAYVGRHNFLFSYLIVEIVRSLSLRHYIEFNVEGTTLRALLYTPDAGVRTFPT